ncbi:MAG: arylsulfatase [Balneolaceae bacterium]
MVSHSRYTSSWTSLWILMAGLMTHSCVPADRTPDESEVPMDDRPDIILIMADDMGFSDIGSYGSEIRTPTLDGLASDGVRFREFYNHARCMPTRASLMTGRYPHQAGVGGMEPDRGFPGYRGNLNHESVTLAEALRINGYRTYMVGKWHLTRHNAANEVAENKFNWPLQRGFDRYYGSILGAGSFYGPNTLTRGNRNIDEGRVFPGAVWAPPADAELPVMNDGSYYYTDVINSTGAQFIRDHHETQKEDPFFLYVAHTAPHWPLHAPEEDVEPYLDLYRQGWDEIRRQRYERMIELDVIDASWNLPDRPQELPAWEDLDIEGLPDQVREAIETNDLEIREELALRMSIHAAMVERMDRGIGEIIDALKETGRFENTLIMFLTDNGAASEWGTYGIGWPRMTATGAKTGSPQSYASIGVAWAHVSNSPFRYWKLYNHEGGAATSFIAHWPKGIDAKGEWRDQTGHIIDVMPTLMEVSGSTYPEQYNGHQIEPYEGVSLLPAFRNETLNREEPLFFEHMGRRAVRDGRWKLVTTETGIDGRWELYDMESDRTETRDLADEHPERVEQMAAAWLQWAERAHVQPMVPDQQ